MRERFGDYELLHKIATGGMAEIYLARVLKGPKQGELLVVKRMLPELAVRDDFVTMFLDEARLAANFDHVNVVKVFNLGEVQKAYFMAMELIDGPHLGALFAHSLRLRKPLPAELCAYACARAAEGLDYAHDLKDAHTGRALKIVHRDISPQNILVSRDGTVKVTDFGVAKATTQEAKTRTGIIKGKVSYMSPEQCLGEKVDRRTDVFALGIVLYELLTRRRLFRDRSDLLVMQRITNKDVAPPSTLNPSLDKDLDTICTRALARNRRKRFARASDLASALDLWLEVNGHYRCGERLAQWLNENAAHLCLTATIEAAKVPNTQTVPAITGNSDLDATVVAPPNFKVQGTSDDDATVIAPKPTFDKEPFQPLETETLGLRPGQTQPGTPPPMRTDEVSDGTYEIPVSGSISETDPERLDPPPPTLTETVPDTRARGPSPSAFSAGAADSLPSIVSQSASSPPWGAIAGALVVVAFIAAGAWAFLKPAEKAEKPVTVSLGDPKAARADTDVDGGAIAQAPGEGVPADKGEPGPPSDEGKLDEKADADAKVAMAEPTVALKVSTVPSGVPVFVGVDFLGTSPVEKAIARTSKGDVVAHFDDGAVSRKVSFAQDEVKLTLYGRVKLKLTSSPKDADVVIDGGQYSRFESRTPIDGAVLLEPEVKYTFTVSKDGYDESSFTLVPAPGKVATKSVTLKKQKVKKTKTKTKTKRPARSSTTRAEDRSSKQPAVKGTGTLRLFSSVAVQVKVGKKRFTSPVRDETVPAGSQLFVVTNKDLGITSRFRANVPKGKRITVKLFFDKKGDKYVLSRKVIE